MRSFKNMSEWVLNPAQMSRKRGYIISSKTIFIDSNKDILSELVNINYTTKNFPIYSSITLLERL